MGYPQKGYFDGAIGQARYPKYDKFDKHDKFDKFDKDEDCNVFINVNCGEEEKRYPKQEKCDRKKSGCNVFIIINCGDDDKDYYDDYFRGPSCPKFIKY